MSSRSCEANRAVVARGRASVLVALSVVPLLAQAGTGQVVFRPAILSASPISGDVQAEPVLGDLDGDGLPDMVRRQAFGSAVLLNQGGGIFGPPARVASLQFPAIVDMDGDGSADIVGIALGLSGGPPTVRVLTGLGDGTFGTPLETDLVVAHPSQMSVLDLDHDGWLDVVVQSGIPIFTRHSVELYRGRGDGTFDVGVTVFTSPTSFPLEQVVGDVDGDADGRSELVLVSTLGGAFGGLMWTLDGTLDGSIGVKAGQLPVSVESADGADMNGDGILDLLCLSDGQYVSFPGNGDGTFGEPVPAVEGGVVVRHLGGDFDGDGLVDLLARPADGLVRVWLGSGDCSFRSAITFGGDVDYAYPGVADLDLDGRDDVVLIGTDRLARIDLAAAYLNATYAEESPFDDLGGATPLPGSGYPLQIAKGRLLPRTPYRFEALGLPAAGQAWLVLGTEAVPATGGGDALVPTPDLVLGPFPAGAAGTVDVHGTWPMGLPSGLVFYMQYVVDDGLGSVGRSSLVRAMTP